jgi:hypothetical protein
MVANGQARHIVEWLRSRRRDYLLDRPSPWITFDARLAVRRMLRDRMRVFEYGSGGSTLFWLAHGASCVSVEHDVHWIEAIKPYVDRLRATAQLDHRLVVPRKQDSRSTGLDVSDPTQYLSADAAFAGWSFEAYARQIDEFPDDYFDIVLVDGRARPACIAHSASKVCRGGLLIVDNADRAYYFAHTGHILRPFQRTSYCGAGPIAAHAWQTDFFIRN